MKENEALSVTQINRLIKGKLEGDPDLSHFYLRGEISNFKIYPSGHAYFTLKDEESLISAVMWSSGVIHLSFAPKNGDEVICRGSISVYPPRGSYQFVASTMELSGEGAELLRLKMLFEKLQKEGLFDPAKKKKIPAFPHKIAVIAGKGSAGLADIIRNLQLRWPLVDIVVIPSLVHGKEAPASLRKALKIAVSKEPSTIIVGRGGGASEDLSAFNDEDLIRDIAALEIPLISAVGHEVDVTLIDFVSDLRVSTPTGAATAAVPDKNEMYRLLDDSSERLLSAMKAILGRKKERFLSLSQRPYFSRPEAIYEQKRLELKNTKDRFLLLLGTKLANYRHSLESSKGRLAALNPYGVLARGYSLTVDEKGKVIQSLEQVEEGDTLQTRLRDGTVTAKVIRKDRNHGKRS